MEKYYKIQILWPRKFFANYKLIVVLTAEVIVPTLTLEMSIDLACDTDY